MMHGTSWDEACSTLMTSARVHFLWLLVPRAAVRVGYLAVGGRRPEEGAL